MANSNPTYKDDKINSSLSAEDHFSPRQHHVEVRDIAAHGSQTSWEHYKNKNNNTSDLLVVSQ